MESKEYFEKVMQDYNQHGNGRSLRKYCKDEAVDYNWLIEFKKTYPSVKSEATSPSVSSFIPLTLDDPRPVHSLWSVESLVLCTSGGERVEIKSSSLFVVAEMLHKMSRP